MGPTTARVSFGSRAGGPSDYAKPNIGGRSFGSMPFSSLDELQDALRAEIKAGQESLVPECTTAELSLRSDAVIPLQRPTIGPYAEGGEQDLPAEFKTTSTRDDGTVVFDPNPVATVDSIINIHDARGRKIVQRAASRGIIQAVEAADGFRYSFNNAWAAKDEEGSRFSYICQDSMQNKDRHANGFTRTVKHLKGDEKGPRKPTYDCKGSLSVKFSTARQSLDIYYRHNAIHTTVAERKSLPRPVSMPRPHPEESGGLRETLQHQAKAASQMAMTDSADDSPLAARPEDSNIGRPLKRKRESGYVPMPYKDVDRPLSLAELLMQSETANAPPPQPGSSKPDNQPSAPPMSYHLPSWHPPPSTNNAPDNAYASPYSHRPPPPYPTPTQVPQPPIQHIGPTQPKPQGLFTTMKPTSKENYRLVTPQTFSKTSYGGATRQRASLSCTNCRLAKRKCDEGQPCGGCIKARDPECAYEPVPRAPPKPAQIQPRSLPPPPQEPAQPPQPLRSLQPSPGTYPLQTPTQQQTAGLTG